MKLFCIAGETASGKDTLVKMILEKIENTSTVKSFSTRPMRENEIEGVEHYFVDKETFDKIRNDPKNEVLAYTKITNEKNPDGYEYMALKSELEHSNIYIIDPNGIHYIKEKYSDIDIVVIYIYAPLCERRERAKSRSDFEKEFNKRVANEKEQFSKFRDNHEYDYIIYNTDKLKDKSIDVISSIFRYEMKMEKLEKEHCENYSAYIKNIPESFFLNKNIKEV